MAATFTLTGRLLDKSKRPLKRVTMVLTATPDTLADPVADENYISCPEVITDDNGYLTVAVDGAPSATPGVTLVVGAQYTIRGVQANMLGPLTFNTPAAGTVLNLADILPVPADLPPTWSTIIARIDTKDAQQDARLVAIEAAPPGASAVSSVAGRTGAVVLTKTDVGLANVDNTTDVAKPVSTAQATADTAARDAAIAAAATDATTKANAERDRALAAEATKAPLSHVTDTTNPHAVTKAQVGLGLADNTADASKPVSTAQQAAINVERDRALAVEAVKADLVGGKVPSSQIAAISTHETVTVASQTARLALTTAQVQPGDEAIVTGGTNAEKGRWLLTAADPSLTASWLRLSAPGGIQSVNGQTVPDVVLGAADVGATPAAHATDATNPHAVTKAQVGLGAVPNVDATARANHTGIQSLDTTTDSATRLALTPTERTQVAAALPVTIVDAKGDLIVGTANDTAARLAVGTDGQGLVADSASPGGVKWDVRGATAQDEGVALTRRGILNFVGAGVTATDDATGLRTTVTIPGGGAAATGWTTPSTSWHAPHVGTVGGITPTAGVQYLWPFELRGDLSTATMRLEVTTAVTGSSLRAGIYLPDNVTGLPDFTTLRDFGTALSATAAVKDFTRTITTLPANRLLWLTLLALGGAPTVRSTAAPGQYPIFPLPAGISPPLSLVSWGLSVTATQTDLAVASTPTGSTNVQAMRAFLRNDA